MQIILKIGIAVCNIIYSFHKLAPTRNRVAAISRQSATLTIDMAMLMEEIRRQDPDVEIITLNRMVPKGLLGKIGYIFYMIGTEMHVMATSRVVVLEGYCINASILHHKKSLKIVQLWHALGALKKFGFLAVGTAEGHSPELAKAMHMHENYDYVLCSSEFVRPVYAKAFHYPVEQVKVMPLPRTDRLQDPKYMETKRRAILAKYPELAAKKNILYAPTFRKGEDIEASLHALFDAVDFERYNLIVKLHPIDRTKVDSPDVFQCKEFRTMELFSVADILVSDYSSIIFEAATAGIPVYLYTYDLASYLEKRGFCIDFMTDIPLPKYKTAEDLMRDIDADAVSADVQHAFISRYVEPGNNYTETMARFILELCERATP